MIESGAIRLLFAWNWWTRLIKSFRLNLPRKSKCCRRGLILPWIRSRGREVMDCCWLSWRYFSQRLITSSAPCASATILSAQTAKSAPSNRVELGQSTQLAAMPPPAPPTPRVRWADPSNCTIMRGTQMLSRTRMSPGHTSTVECSRITTNLHFVNPAFERSSLMRGPLHHGAFLSVMLIQPTIVRTNCPIGPRILGCSACSRCSVQSVWVRW